MMKFCYMPLNLGRHTLGIMPCVLLRKEVIQPQLPLRLPCYDLALLTGFTFGVFPP